MISVKSIESPKRINREFIYQFLPSKLEPISKNKFVQFKNRNLKSSYLIDIVHNLILKFYFKKENKFPLSSLILKEKYGFIYNYYIDYLVENEILILNKNYLKGSNSRIYSLNSEILNSEISRFKSTEKILLKKYCKKFNQYEIDQNNIINRDVKLKLIEDLYHIKIEFDRVIFYLDSIKNNIDNYNRNKYSAESIKEGHIFYHFDQYGRMHTNFTILKSFIRKNCLLIDGEETCEIDIPNSQPLFLSKLIHSIDSKWINKEELDFFTKLVESGKYYQFLINKLDLPSKSEAKDITYKVMFGQNRKSSDSDVKFQSLFPTIHLFVKFYKKEFSDYRIISHHLQKMESNLIFNKVISKIIEIDPKIRIVTIHDSLIVQKKWKDLVSSILDEEISKI